MDAVIAYKGTFFFMLVEKCAWLRAFTCSVLVQSPLHSIKTRGTFSNHRKIGYYTAGLSAVLCQLIFGGQLGGPFGE